MTSATEPVQPPGSRLAHYEIESELGSGAKGTVYKARDTALDRPVAVKILRARLAGEPSVVERFVREARAAARVNHPNLTHIYFVGAEHGCQFFAMEYVPGTTFEQEIAAHGPMPFAKFVDVIVQSARGLAAAHGAGVIHRDVKPSNLMLLPDGTVKVTDFGLAKSLGGDVDASGGGMLLGTPTYMAPEQCRGRGVDARTDVYALGLTAWFLLAGKPPFVSESLGQMLQDQMNTPLPSVREVRPDLPPAIDRVLAVLCEKDPAKRPAKMEEVAALFEDLRPRPLEPATFMARFSAMSIDVGLMFAAGALASVVYFGSHELAAEYLGGFQIVPKYVSFLLFVAAVIVLNFGAEAWFQTTPGKWLFNLEVVRADGAAPSRTALFARFWLRFPFVIGFMAPHAVEWLSLTATGLQTLAVLAGAIAFVAAGGRTLTDLVTRTRVVYRSRRPLLTA
jgi:tRNA A-37 threonylcarbamoyl transferase component Bud32/uncharacterized RDD family membrane protein YckC